jgi:hypothetical protein
MTPFTVHYHCELDKGLTIISHVNTGNCGVLLIGDVTLIGTSPRLLREISAVAASLATELEATQPDPIPDTLRPEAK